MAKKVYTGKFAQFHYYGDMSGNVDIISVTDGARLTIPASDLVEFVSHNIVEDESSIMRAIVQSSETPITHLDMNFEILRKVSNTWG